ncbi:MAG: response regulator transcription factor [Bacteroidales bacterium]|nr:response regulator transcription factor [Bacteroidales bacterium]
MRELKCFLVDDEKDAIERLSLLLGKLEGIAISGMDTDPETAVESILQKQPDLIFVDVEMPGLSGFELVKTLRKEGFHPGFIFVTGYNQYAIKAIRTEAFDFLVKPVDIDELKESIQRFRESFHCKSAEKKVVPAVRALFSERELEIIPLLARGKSSLEIAGILNISKNTVDTHRKNILARAGLHKTQELSIYAMENGLF